MYAPTNKKMLNMLILEILRKHSDEDHALTQQDIIKILKNDYAMTCDRRSVKNNIVSLKEMGYDIEDEHGYKLLTREFSDSELRILINSILFSKSISVKQAKDLIEKIRSLGSDYFTAKVSNINNLPELRRTDNKQALYSLDLVNDAITKKRKISFIYNEYGTDFKLHPKRTFPSVVNPYQIVASNDRFYLIGNYDKFDDVVHFRIDKMTDVMILDDLVKPIKKIPELANGLNLSKHMAEHIYMFSGESINAKLKTIPGMMGTLVDWFGTDFSIVKANEKEMTVRICCNEMALRYWALQYGPYVEVMSPKSLRDKIKEDVKCMWEKYE